MVSFDDYKFFIFNVAQVISFFFTVSIFYVLWCFFGALGAHKN